MSSNDPAAPAGNTAGALREELFATLRALRAGAINVETAKAVSDVAQTIINSAKVEVDYLRINESGQSAFFDGDKPPAPGTPGITGSRVHRLR